MERPESGNVFLPAPAYSSFDMLLQPPAVADGEEQQSAVRGDLTRVLRVRAGLGTVQATYNRCPSALTYKVIRGVLHLQNQEYSYHSVEVLPFPDGVLEFLFMKFLDYPDGNSIVTDILKNKSVFPSVVTEQQLKLLVPKTIQFLQKHGDQEGLDCCVQFSLNRHADYILDTDSYRNSMFSHHFCDFFTAHVAATLVELEVPGFPFPEVPGLCRGLLTLLQSPTLQTASLYLFHGVKCSDLLSIVQNCLQSNSLSHLMLQHPNEQGYVSADTDMNLLPLFVADINIEAGENHSIRTFELLNYDIDSEEHFFSPFYMAIAAQMTSLTHLKIDGSALQVEDLANFVSWSVTLESLELHYVSKDFMFVLTDALVASPSLISLVLEYFGNTAKDKARSYEAANKVLKHIFKNILLENERIRTLSIDIWHDDPVVEDTPVDGKNRLPDGRPINEDEEDNDNYDYDVDNKTNEEIVLLIEHKCALRRNLPPGPKETWTDIQVGHALLSIMTDTMIAPQYTSDDKKDQRDGAIVNVMLRLLKGNVGAAVSVCDALFGINP